MPKQSKDLPPLPPAPTPLRKKRGKQPAAETIKTHELVDRVLELRYRGYALAVIARHVGVTDSIVAAWLAEAWDRLPQREPANREAVLSGELEKLDLLELQYIGLAMAGVLGACDRVLEFMDRRAKYLGLYAPTKNEHDVRMSGSLSLGFKSKEEKERELRAAIAARKAAALQQVALPQVKLSNSSPH